MLSLKQSWQTLVLKLIEKNNPGEREFVQPIDWHCSSLTKRVRVPSEGGPFANVQRAAGDTLAKHGGYTFAGGSTCLSPAKKVRFGGLGSAPKQTKTKQTRLVFMQSGREGNPFSFFLSHELRNKRRMKATNLAEI